MFEPPSSMPPRRSSTPHEASPEVATPGPIEQAMRALVAHGDFVLFALDAEGVFTLSEGRGLRLLGLQPGQVVGRSLFEVYGQDPEACAGAERALRGEAHVQVIELRATRLAWEIRWVPTVGPDGAVTGVTAIASEVSERKRDEDTLRALADGLNVSSGEAFFCAIVKFLAESCGTSWAFVSEEIDPGSGRMRTLAFYDEGELGESVEYDLAGTACAEVFARGPLSCPSGVPQRFPGSGGDRQRRYDAYIGVPLFDAAGRPLGVLGVTHGAPIANAVACESLLRIVASRVEAQLERLRAERALRQNEERVRQLDRQKDLILQAAGEGIYGLDQDGRVTFVNAAAARMLGLASEALVGRMVLGEAGLAPDAVLGCLAYGLCEGGVEQAWQEEVFWRADGTCFLVEYTAIPMLDDGRSIGSVVTFRDIRHRRRAEVELQQAYADLQRLNRHKDEFLSTVSHEVRTPLVAIKNAISILQKGRAGAINERQAQFVAMIGEQTERLNQLLDDLLDSQKIESGCMAFDLAEGDLAGLLEEVSGGFRDVFESGGLRLVLELPEGPLRARFDRARLGQVVLNLLSNAAKFTPAGGTIRVCAVAEPGAVRFGVIDTGIGISSEHLPRLFDKFFQVDRGLTRHVSGTGLGLSICKMIVEEGHLGCLWVESALGEGSAFWVSLPTG